MLPLTFPFPDDMAKWPVLLDEFRFEIVSHGGQKGIQMRILGDKTNRSDERLGAPSRPQIGASRGRAKPQRR